MIAFWVSQCLYRVVKHRECVTLGDPKGEKGKLEDLGLKTLIRKG